MKQVKAYPSSKDKVAALLYADQSNADSLLLEVEAINRVESLWLTLNARLEQGQVSQAVVEETLSKVDGWLKNRLSGTSMLTLLLSAEIKYPHFIRYMPETLASRYEEIRVARIWSSLLDPESLIRLRIGIEFEKNMSGDL